MFKNTKGFTLIEIMVVLSIIAFLVTVISSGLSESRKKTTDTRRISDVFAVQKAMELYFNENNEYPSGSSLVLGTGSAKCLSESGFNASCPGGEKRYLYSVPRDPLVGDSTEYEYTQTSGGTDYQLVFTIDTDIGDIKAGAHILTSTGVE